MAIWAGSSGRERQIDLGEVQVPPGGGAAHGGGGGGRSAGPGPLQAPATGLNLEGNWGSEAIWYLPKLSAT